MTINGNKVLSYEIKKDQINEDTFIFFMKGLHKLITKEKINPYVINYFG